MKYQISTNQFGKDIRLNRQHVRRDRSIQPIITLAIANRPVHESILQVERQPHHMPTIEIIFGPITPPVFAVQPRHFHRAASCPVEIRFQRVDEKFSHDARDDDGLLLRAVQVRSENLREIYR